eukprot:m.67490 g.67490  ORF g.67490 m.67490 type:complete len:81 (-) comp23820_c0_seq2:285-527(-)
MLKGGPEDSPLMDLPFVFERCDCEDNKFVRSSTCSSSSFTDEPQQPMTERSLFFVCQHHVHKNFISTSFGRPGTHENENE